MIYDYTVKTRTGEDLKLSDMKGKVIMIVNTATGCGFTPQYAPIEQLYRDYHDKGLEIIDIPCNQFGTQAPGSDDEIHEFCVTKYNTTFPQMKKSDVNGENELPLYTFLKSQAKGKLGNAIKWNFTKFLVGRDGTVLARFAPADAPAAIEKNIAEALNA